MCYPSEYENYILLHNHLNPKSWHLAATMQIISNNGQPLTSLRDLFRPQRQHRPFGSLSTHAHPYRNASR